MRSKERIEVSSSVLEKTRRAEEELKKHFPNLRIIITRGKFSVTLIQKLKYGLGALFFGFIYKDEKQARQEIFFNTAKEHITGIGFDIRVYNTETKTYFPKLPPYNIYMTKNKAEKIWNINQDVLNFLQLCLRNNGIMLSKDVRERLQMHCVVM